MKATQHCIKLDGGKYALVSQFNQAIKTREAGEKEARKFCNKYKLSFPA